MKNRPNKNDLKDTSEKNSDTGSALSTIPKYRIGTVSRLSGLSTDLIRIWEKRYQAVTPSRDEKNSNNSRLYSEADVARLRLLRQAVESGHPIGRVADLPNNEIQELLGLLKSQQNIKISLDDTPYPIAITRFKEALQSFNIKTADAELSTPATILERRLFIKHILVPLIQDISVDESLSGVTKQVGFNLIRNLIGALSKLHSYRHGPEIMILVSHSDEADKLRMLSATLLASSHGLNAYYIGADLSSFEIYDSAIMTKADVLVVSKIESAANLGSLPTGLQVWIYDETIATNSEDDTVISHRGFSVIRNVEELDLRFQR